MGRHIVIERSIHKGPCADCGLPMISQGEWARNPTARPGRVKHQGRDRCNPCYMRARRNGTLALVSVEPTRFVVRCDEHGLVAEVGDQEKADQLRAEHLAEEHGVRPATAPLSAAELARLRRSVGLAS